MAGDIVIFLDGARTAIGTFGGSLAAIPPIELAAAAIREALARSGVEAGQIGQVVFGHVIDTEPRDMYLSRAAAIEAGVPDTTPAMNVNRLCGSGAAGDRLVCAGALPPTPTSRWRRRGEHVALALRADRGALGPERWATRARWT